MFMYLLYVLVGAGYLNYGRYLVDKEIEASENKDRKLWEKCMAVLFLPLWAFGEFSVFCTKKAILALDKVFFAPALYLRGKRAKKARLKAAEEPEEPVDPKLLAEAEEAADRAMHGLPDLDPDPEPEIELELVPELESDNALNQVLNPKDPPGK